MPSTQIEETKSTQLPVLSDVNSRALLSDATGEEYSEQRVDSRLCKNSEIAPKSRYRGDVASADGANHMNDVLSKSSDNEDDAVYEEYKDLDESIPQIQ